MSLAGPVDESTVAAVLLERYGVRTTAFKLLAGGLDTAAWTYRVAEDQVLRLTRGPVAARTFALPFALHAAGVNAVVAPLPDRAGALAVDSEGLTWALYPYIDGLDGYGGRLTDALWRDLGRVLRAVHTVRIPDGVRALLAVDAADAAAYDAIAEVDAVRAEPFAATWRRHRDTARAMLDQMHALSGALQADPRPRVVCHGDLHPGNVLVGSDGLRLVDWDCVLLAVPERDLIFAPPAVLEGYGPLEVDRPALTYYRCERVLQDVLSEARRASYDAVEAERWLRHFFRPGGEADDALAAARCLPTALNRLASAARQRATGPE